VLSPSNVIFATSAQYPGAGPTGAVTGIAQGYTGAGTIFDCQTDDVNTCSTNPLPGGIKEFHHALGYWLNSL